MLDPNSFSLSPQVKKQNQTAQALPEYGKGPLNRDLVLQVKSRPGNYIQNPTTHPTHPLISEVGLDNLGVGSILSWVIKIQIYFG